VSTRCTTHFHSDYGRNEVEAIVFRHTDGYPKEAGADLLKFFDAIEAQAPHDTRFDDASMLAARYVVFLSRMFTRTYTGGGEWENYGNERPLDFISVRVLQEDTADTEYVYHVYCKEGGRPKVTVDNLNTGETLPLQEAVEKDKADRS
jgi:hypothetical protein